MGREGLEVFAEFIADAAEEGEPFLFGALQRGGVFEVAVYGDGVAGKDRAAFLGVVADGQNVIEMPARRIRPRSWNGGRKCRCPARA